jgi:channel protein (hemolysin III family)
MSTTEMPAPVDDEYPKSVAHAMGYLMAIAALPPLAMGLPWKRSLLTALAVLLLVALLRAYLGMSVRGVLSRVRAKAVLGGADMAAFFLLVASGYTVYALDALRGNDGWAPFLGIWALAALGCSVRMLTRAHRTWFSNTFLSRFSESQPPF